MIGPGTRGEPPRGRRFALPWALSSGQRDGRLRGAPLATSAYLRGVGGHGGVGYRPDLLPDAPDITRRLTIGKRYLGRPSPSSMQIL